MEGENEGVSGCEMHHSPIAPSVLKKKGTFI